MGQPRSWFCSIIALMQGMLGRASGVVLAGLFAAMPTSTNYSLKGYDLGGSGNSGSSSSYKLNATAGSQGTNASSSASYGENAGQPAVNTSNVPPAPTFTNPSSYYDRLQLVLATGARNLRPPLPGLPLGAGQAGSWCLAYCPGLPIRSRSRQCRVTLASQLMGRLPLRQPSIRRLALRLQQRSARRRHSLLALVALPLDL